MPELTLEQIGLLVAAALAVLFEYFPRLKTWYDVKPDNEQRLIMLGLTAVVTIALFARACGADQACWQGGWDTLVTSFLINLGVNQGVHRALPRSTKNQAPAASAAR